MHDMLLSHGITQGPRTCSNHETGHHMTVSNGHRSRQSVELLSYFLNCSLDTKDSLTNTVTSVSMHIHTHVPASHRRASRS